jgi:aminotransferase
MRERSVLVNSMSKTFSVTGWRVGWVIAAPELTSTIRKVHDFLTVGAAAPLQQASALALTTEESYYEGLALDYRERRDFMVKMLTDSGFRCYSPAGAYYVMTDISDFPETNDRAFATKLIENYGIAAVPGSSFYENGENIRQIRFCFCKSYETLEKARRRLQELHS